MRITFIWSCETGLTGRGDLAICFDAGAGIFEVRLLEGFGIELTRGIWLLTLGNELEVLLLSTFAGGKVELGGTRIALLWEGFGRMVLSFATVLLESPASRLV